MAKRYYNLEKETKAFLKRMEEVRGVLPDMAGIQRVNDYIVKRKGLGLFQGTRRKAATNFIASQNQSLSIASNSTLQVKPSWEVISWIFPRTNNLEEFVSKGDNSASLLEFTIRRTTSNFTLGTGTGTVYVSFSGPAGSAPINTWNFVSVGRIQDTQELFLSVNNSSQTKVQQTTQAIGSAQFRIGDWSPGGRPANAVIADTARWDRNLSTEERTYLYNSGQGRSFLEILAFQPTIFTNMVSYWTLTEASGIRYDWYGSNHLAPVNSPLGTEGIIENFF